MNYQPHLPPASSMGMQPVRSKVSNPSPSVSDRCFQKMPTPPLHTVTLMDSSHQQFMFPVLPPQALQMTTIGCPMQVHPSPPPVLINNPMVQQDTLPGGSGKMVNSGNLMYHGSGNSKQQDCGSAVTNSGMMAASGHSEMANMMMNQSGQQQQQQHQHMDSPFLRTVSPTSDLTHTDLLSPNQLSPFEIQMSPIVTPFMLSPNNSSPCQSPHSSQPPNS